MPIYDAVCTMCENRSEQYVSHEFERQRLLTCSSCGGVLAFLPSLGAKPLTYFSEGAGGKWIHNLGDKPVFITSEKQRQDIMKREGLAEAAPRYGEKNCWS